jgi:hypothetical protein
MSSSGLPLPTLAASASSRSPGIGPVVATAIVAAIGNGAAFRKGREFSAWLGIVPKQHSTGGRARLLGISKRGNTYVRKILIHGARAAVLRIKRDRVPIGAWMDALEARAHRNVLIVAMANKLVRIAWAVLSSGEEYRPCASGICPHATVINLSPRSALELYKTTETVTTTPRNLQPKRVSNDRPVYKEGHVRNSSWPGARCSTQRPNTFAQTLSRPELSLAVARRTIHFRTK